MNIIYANNKIKDCLENISILQKKCGKHAKMIKKRMNELKSFPNLKEMFIGGLDNPHFEKGEFKGMIGWSINQNVRMLIKINENIDEKLLGKMEEIKEVEVIGVLDYHGGKNNWIIN